MGPNAKATPDSRHNGTNGFRRNVFSDRSCQAAAAAWPDSRPRTFSLCRLRELHRMPLEILSTLGPFPARAGYAAFYFRICPGKPAPPKKAWSSASIGIGRISVSRLDGCWRPTPKARRKNTPSSMYKGVRTFSIS